MIRFFENAKHAQAYAKFRPSTPKKVAEIAMKYATERGNRGQVLVDVGCGAGQSSEIFSPHFAKIIGIDPSENQIKQAKIGNKFSNIEYLVGNGETMGFSDETIDMVVCSQSIHWLDFKKFFNECHRVLRGEGCLVVHGYDRPIIRGFGGVGNSGLLTETDNLFREYYQKCLFHPRRHHVEDHYREIEKLIVSRHKIRDDSVKIEFEGKFSDFISYLATWSGYRSYMEQILKQTENSGNPALNLPESESDILVQFCSDLKALWGCPSTDNDAIMVSVTWDIFIILSERPLLQN